MQGRFKSELGEDFKSGMRHFLWYQSTFGRSSTSLPETYHFHGRVVGMDGDPAVESELDTFSLILPLPYRVAVIFVLGIPASSP